MRCKEQFALQTVTEVQQADRSAERESKVDNDGLCLVRSDLCRPLPSQHGLCSSRMCCAFDRSVSALLHNRFVVLTIPNSRFQETNSLLI